jgi:hypothetical protein
MLEYVLVTYDDLYTAAHRLRIVMVPSREQALNEH